MSAWHAMYPGTFDPVTFGHIDILRRALRLFDEVTVAVAAGGRSTLLDHETRLDVLRRAVTELPDRERVHVVGFDGLLVETLRREQAQVVVRGLRGVADLEHEQAMAAMNLSLDPDFEVVTLFSRPEYAMLSASLVRDVARCGGPLENYAPASAVAALRARFQD